MEKVFYTPVQEKGVFTPEECARIINIAHKTGMEPGTPHYDLIEQNDKMALEHRLALEAHPPMNSETVWIADRCYAIADDANNQFDFDVDYLMPLEWFVARYEAGGHFSAHLDMTAQCDTRKITGTIQLTDESMYTGGDLMINGFGAMQREQGSVTMFPPFLLHSVYPVITGTRYALIFWVHGKSHFS